MPLSLTQMPKQAYIEFEGEDGETIEVAIENYETFSNCGLFYEIMDIVNWLDLGSQILNKFEKHGVSFETAIEYCVEEIEKNTRVRVWLIWWHHPVKVADDPPGSHWDRINIFLNSATGGAIIEQYIEKIRNCDNWEELYDEFHHTSKFQQDMKSRICKELEQCPKV